MGYGMSNSSSMGAMKERIPSGYKKASLQNFTPEQMELFQSLFSQLGPDSFLSQIAGGDEDAFAQLEAPALRQHNAEIGNLASRFSGMGMGARNSSGFQNAAGAQASDFAQRLQSNRMDLRRQALNDLMGLSNTLLNQRPFEQALVPKKQNQTAEMFGKFGGAVPGLISSAMGGGSPGSALKGAMSIFGG